MYHLILPTQLFDKKYLDKKKTILLWEHPHYFKGYKYNKKKIMLHKLSMLNYYDYLKKHKFKVKYIKYKENINRFLDNFNYIIFDPIDKIKLPKNYLIINSPGFLLTSELIDVYRYKTDKYFFNSFYNWFKKELNIMPDTKSMDKYNQTKYSRKLENSFELSKKINNKLIKQNINYNKKNIHYKKVIDLINKEFKSNYGITEEFFYPINFYQARKLLKIFILYKLKHFGDYQDIIHKDNLFLFHSLLSSSINIGLLTPSYVIKEVYKLINSNKLQIKINNLEGFIRQLFWREYQRYCYKFINYKTYIQKPYFKQTKTLSKSWYSGNTGILPIDNCITKGFKYGYLHHIERLMLIGNFMLLSGIKPKQGYKWFMEFSCDSYEWVMHQNVYDMVFFITGGKTMRKPYFSSSNYILNMSNYTKDKWCELWNKEYKNFIKINRDKLQKYKYYYKNI